MSSNSMSRDGGVIRRAGLTVALALAALAALPAIASAASVAFNGATDTITYSAVAGETNSVVIDDSSSTSYTFAETGISESAAECTDGGDVITCTFGNQNDIDTIVANAGDMGDTVDAAGITTEDVQLNGEADGDTITGGSQDDSGGTGLSGGAGDDIINGGAGDDEINGGDDNDYLFGSGNDDDINGDAGNDRMDGGDASNDEPDDFDGGAGIGIDRVVYGILDPPGTPNFSYTCTDQAVILDMDNSGDDDSCADGDDDNDNVRDSVESVTGSTLGDTITGSCFANTFAGDPGSASGNAGGNDTLNGDPTGGCTAAAGSTDFFGGGEGNDVFNGDGLIDATHFRGFDTVTYGFPYTGAATGTCSGQAVTTGFAVNIDLDDVADDCDGFGNTTDNVLGDIERVIGSGEADRINATAADQGVFLFGRLGNDTFTDSTFGDNINGEGGTDTANCPNGGTDVTVNVETTTGSCNDV